LEFRTVAAFGRWLHPEALTRYNFDVRVGAWAAARYPAFACDLFELACRRHDEWARCGVVHRHSREFARAVARRTPGCWLERAGGRLRVRFRNRAGARTCVEFGVGAPPARGRPARSRCTVL
jgi:hypothetical protein